MKNIYLTGMPGSGKTTVGKLLATQLGLTLVDMDSIISEAQGKTINEIFEAYGEEFFRDLEADTLKKLSEKENLIVSTGGGVILREENRQLLKSGTVVFIDLSPEIIIKRSDFSDRPLLKDNKNNLTRLYAERYEKYKECAHIIVCGDQSPLSVAMTIKSFMR